MNRWTRVLFRIPLTLAVTGVLLIALVRLAPGYGVDEKELDLRFTSENVDQMREVKKGTLALVAELGGKALRGDFGNSEIFGMPVKQLLAERWPLTLQSIVVGLSAAWLLALLWAASGALFPALDWAGSFASFGLLSFPSGVMAILLFLAGAPVAAGIAVAVFPQLYRYVRELTLDAFSQPCIFAAAARGVGRVTLLTRHARALITPQLLALLGTSAASATAASIPFEAISGAPGLGQLAWRAALGRDLPLLLPLVLAITLIIQSASITSELLQPARAAEGEDLV